MEQIKGLEGYLISKDGIVYSLKRKRILTNYQRKDGYISIFINNKTYKIHRLLALQFIENIDNKPFINHINGIKNDNRLENLEWVTAKENTVHAWDNNLCKPIRYWKGKFGANHKSSVAILQYDLQGNFIAKHIGMREIGIKLNVKYQNISKCVRGINKQAYGYIWKYDTELQP
jgi:hypothetical protein